MRASGAAGEAGTTAVPLVSLDAGDGRAMDLSWRGVLPEPVVSGHTARYANALTATDLVVESTRTGFEQFLELKDRSAVGANGSVTLTLNAKGIKARANADRSVTFLDKKSGKQVGSLPAPVMWDAHVDPKSGEHTRRADVGLKVTQKGDAVDLTLTPDAKFLADPARVFPVTVDPAVNLGSSFDTFVQQGYTTDMSSSTELKIGNNGSGQVARSFLHFPMTQIRGKQILGAKLNLWNFHSWSCTPTGWEVWDTPHASTATRWTNQPGFTNKWATSTATKGFSSSCADGWVSQDIKNLAVAWAANGNSSNSMGIKATTETGTNAELGWKRFNSGNAASNTPYVSVTYNTAPVAGNPMSVTPGRTNGGKNWVTTTTPDMGYTTSDAETTFLRSKWELWEGTTNLEVYDSGTQDPVVNKTVSHQAPAGKLVNGRTYWFKGRVNDGNSWSNWTPSVYFTVDTTRPATSTVTSGDFPANTWSGTPGADGKFSGSFTFTPPATDVAEVQYRLDGGSWSSVATTGAAVTKALTFAAGKHTLATRTVDPAGNVSTETAHVFYAGSGAALLSPGEGDRPARRTVLSAEGLASYTGVTYQYRHGETDTWKNVPVAAVRRTADGTAISGWPLAVTNGKPAPLWWNVTETLSNDGPVDVRAVFSEGATTAASPEASVVVDRNAGQAPSAQVGPGSLNLLTGDFKLSAKDVSAFDVSVNRTTSSRANPADTEGQAAIFGPGWVSSVSVETSGSGYTQLRKVSDTSVEILTADGDSTAFTATAGGGWTPEVGAGMLTLTGSLTGNSFTLKDTDATVTVFTKASAVATTWTMYTSAAAVDDSTVTVVSETVAQGARPKYLISPTEAVPTATCQAAPTTRGCRVVEFVYATATTATGQSVAADFGDFAGQVKEIRLWATDSGASSARSETLSAYRYDKNGRLRQQWNPHYSQSTQVQYSYDAGNRVSSTTAGPDQPWNFHYGKAGSSLTAGEGMLLKVTRPTLQQGTANTVDGTATTTVVYDVPLTGAKAPRQMSAAAVGAWAQSEVPADATAVFAADSVPASSTGSDLAAGGYERATVTYIDANGRETNTATPGGGLSTTEFDRYGNTVSTLSPANRELALGTGQDAAAKLVALGLTVLSTAERSERLSSASVFSADGQRLADSYGPLQQVTLSTAVPAAGAQPELPAGTAVPARSHTAYRYDEGRPANAAVSGQVTSTSTGAAIEGYPQDADVRTTATAYNWATGEETTTKDEQGTQVGATRSVYDAGGRLASTSLASSNGSDAGTLTYTYYTATGTGECAARPEWAGKLCKTAPAGTITGGGSNPATLPTTVYQYNRWGGVTSTAKTTGGITRTSSVTYDNAGRRVKSSVTGGLGTVTPETTFTFDPDTGRTLTQSAAGRTVTYGYDTLGRITSYNDGAGNIMRTEYDLLDRPVKSADSTGATTVYGYTPEGALGTMTDSVAGTFTAQYDKDGALASQTLPGGYKLKVTTDTLGRVSAREYTDAAGTLVLSDTAEYQITGRQSGRTQTDGITVSTELSYDTAGRLTKAVDNTVTGCVSRAYAFDANSNRKSKTVTADDCDPGTSDAVTDQTSYDYDSADRLVTPGRTYDAFGRTTAKDGVALEYFTADVLRTETVGDQRRTWDLDAVARMAVATTQSRAEDGTWSTTDTVTQHYGDESGSPDWAAHSDGTVTRFVNDVTGALGAVTTGNGVVLQFANLRGDIAVQLDLTAPENSIVQRYDEYGVPMDNTSVARYGWQGSAQISSDTLSGLSLTGVRVYEAATGRFLQSDPQYAGGANAYSYCSGDPVGCRDLSGTADYYVDYDLGKTGASDKSVFNYWKNNFKAVFPIPGRPNKITHKNQKFTLWPVMWGIEMYFPLNVNSIGKSYLQLGARFGHPDWPGGWIGFDLYKSKGRMRLEVRGHLGGLAAICNRSCNEKAGRKYWDKLATNLRNVVRNKF